MCLHNTSSTLNGQDFNLDVKWTDKKIQSLDLAEVYSALGLENKALRLKECGSYLQLALNRESGEKKVYSAHFCKVRLCPMCSWRRSLKIFGQLSKIMDAMKNDGWEFLFLTLTIKNVSPDNLSESISDLLQGYNKGLKRQKEFKNIVFGDYRALEITRNELTGEYHPHLHCILAVLPSYFTNSNYYLSNKKWSKLWAKSMKIDYNPIVDVRKIKTKKSDNKEEKDFSAAVAETAKYTVKSKDYLTDNFDDNLHIVSILDSALANRRLIGMGGVFKEVHKELNLDDPVNGDLIEQVSLDPMVWELITYHWHGTGYVKC